MQSNIFIAAHLFKGQVGVCLKNLITQPPHTTEIWEFYKYECRRLLDCHVFKRSSCVKWSRILTYESSVERHYVLNVIFFG